MMTGNPRETGLMRFSASRERAAPESPSAGRLETLILRYGPYIRDIVARLCPPHLGLERSEIEQTAAIRLWRIVESEREIRDFEPASRCG
jgi:hypothetical protein